MEKTDLTRAWLTRCASEGDLCQRTRDEDRYKAMSGLTGLLEANVISGGSHGDVRTVQGMLESRAARISVDTRLLEKLAFSRPSRKPTYAVNDADEESSAGSPTFTSSSEEHLTPLSSFESSPVNLKPAVESVTTPHTSDTTTHQPSWSYPQQFVHTLVSWAAISRPNSTALKQGSRRLTYGQLLERATMNANELSEHGARHGRIVAIAIDRGIDLIVAMLAVLMTGAAYSIMDPRWPAGKILQVRETTESTIFLTSIHGKLQISLAKGSNYSGDASAMSSYGSGLDSPFCIYHTSGTTGKAKAIIITHRGVLLKLLLAEYPTMFEKLVVLCTAALPWDMFTLEVWFPLLHGGTCVLDSEASLETFRSEDLTTAWLTAARFNVIVEEDIDCLRDLKEIIIGGERLSSSHVQTFLQRHPRINLINGYGPAEGTMLATSHRITLPDCLAKDGIPLGLPLPGNEIRLVARAPDGHLCLASEEEEGEIAIAGEALSWGYTVRSRPARNPFILFTPESDKNCNPRRFYLTGDIGRWNRDGTLGFKGRRDSQLKINGQSIDPYEIEQVILNTGLVAQCVVSARKYKSISTILVAHVVPPQGLANFDRNALNAALDQLLPAYEKPAMLLQMSQLPLTPTGKVDRNNLPMAEREHRSTISKGNQLDGSAIAHVSADTTPEIHVELADKIASLANQLLDLQTCSIHDDLLSEGLDSLGAFKLACRISKAVPETIVFASDILRGHTASHIAEILSRTQAERRMSKLGPEADHHSLSRSSTDTEWSTPWLQTNWFTGMIGVQRQEACLIGFAYRLSGRLPAATLFRTACERIAERHEALRTTIRYNSSTRVFTSSLIPVARALCFSEIESNDMDNRTKLSSSAVRTRAFATMRDVNLTEGPIMSVKVALEAGGAVLIIGVHHATLDGHSESIFAEELSALLANRSLPAVPSYRATLNQVHGETPPDRWSARLAALPPLRWPSSSDTFESDADGVLNITMSRERWKHAADLGKSRKLDFMMVMRAFGAAIKRVQGQNFRLGFVDCGRENAASALTIGNYVRIPIIPMDDQTLGGPVSGMEKAFEEALEHRDVSVATQTAQCASQPLYEGPLAQVLFVWQNVPQTMWTIPGLEVEALQIPRCAPLFDLILDLYPVGDVVWGYLEYDTSVVPREIASNVLHHLVVELEE